MGATCLLRCHVFAQPTLTSDPESALIFDGLKGCSKKQTLWNLVKISWNRCRQCRLGHRFAAFPSLEKLIWKLGSFLWKRLSLRKARWGSSWPYSTCRRSIPNCCESRVQLPVSQHGETETCNFGTSAASAASASPLRTPKDPNLADADFGSQDWGRQWHRWLDDRATGFRARVQLFGREASIFTKNSGERYGKVGIGGYPQVLSPVKKWPSSPSCGTQTTGESQSESVTDLRAGRPVHFKILPATRKTSRKTPFFAY